MQKTPGRQRNSAQFTAMPARISKAGVWGLKWLI